MSRVRERVLSAARKAAAQRAQGEVSVADVARAAKVSWPTANRHLGGKSGLDALLGAPPTPSDPGDTRARLLAAAARCVARSGVDGASLDTVSEEAGATKGALYWHFDTKTALMQALAESTADVGPPPRTLSALIEGHLARSDTALALDVELSAGARDPALATTVRTARAVRRRALAENLSLSSEADAAVILALLDGLAVARRLEPELDVGALAEAARALLRPRPRAGR